MPQLHDTDPRSVTVEVVAVDGRTHELTDSSLAFRLARPGQEPPLWPVARAEVLEIGEQDGRAAARVRLAHDAADPDVTGWADSVVVVDSPPDDVPSPDVDLETYVRELDRRVRAVVAEADAIAALVESAPTQVLRELAAERVPALGSAVVPRLVVIIEDPATPPRVAITAALAGVPVSTHDLFRTTLLERVRPGDTWAVMAANALARAGHLPATDAIITTLESVEPTSRDALQLERALADLGGRLPSRLYDRLTSTDGIASRAVRQDFAPDGRPRPANARPQLSE